MKYTKGQNKKHHSRWVFGVILLIIVAVGGGFWWHKAHPAAKTVQTNAGTAVANPNVPDSTTNKVQTGVTPGAISGAGNSKDLGANTPGQTSSSVQPDKPIGQFVSNPGGPGNPTPQPKIPPVQLPLVRTVRFSSRLGALLKSCPHS